MAAYGAVAYPLLERLRNESNAIEDVLTAYISKGTSIDALPPALAFYNAKSHSATIDLLRQRYIAIQDVEFKLALLDTTRTATSHYADRIRAVMYQAEKVMAIYYAEEFFQVIPRCLVNCYVRGSRQATIAAIRERYAVLRDQEVRLAMVDLELEGGGGGGAVRGEQDAHSANGNNSGQRELAVHSASAPIDAWEDPPGYR
ncbi:hypothetical protein BGZ52_002107 [Haplosporangium bisporale]|nr:hypothetical protein BGZ52_002107 [Haplosporangium bisporale]KAF9211639.1 hypothetical protein BGZ59_007804 [Podila verticillata]